MRRSRRLRRGQGWSLASWDVDRGLVAAEGQAAPGGTADPVAAIRSVNALAKPDAAALLVLPNFHRFLQSTEVIQALAHQVQRGKDNRTFVLVLAPSCSCRRSWSGNSYSSNTTAGGDSCCRSPAASPPNPAELPDGRGPGGLLDAAAGLTRQEAEDAFSLSLVRQGRLSPQALWELKAQAIAKSGPAVAAPGRRAVRGPGRAGRPEGVLLGARPPAAGGPGPGASCCWACRGRGARPRQALGNETGAADPGAGRWAR